MYYDSMDTRQAGRGAETKERLLAAAQELYWQQGVAATTPRQVLQRSGVGQGSLYHHFPAKRDLAETAIGRTAEATLDGARAALEGSGTAMERLHEYLARPRDATAGCRVGRLTSDPTVMSDAGLREPVREYFVKLVDLIAGAFTEDGTAPDVARQRAMTAVAVIQGGYVLSRALDSPAPMQEAVAGLLDLLKRTER